MLIVNYNVPVFTFPIMHTLLLRCELLTFRCDYAIALIRRDAQSSDIINGSIYRKVVRYY
jgi:hypothetical protein